MFRFWLHLHLINLGKALHLVEKIKDIAFLAQEEQFVIVNDELFLSNYSVKYAKNTFTILKIYYTKHLFRNVLRFFLLENASSKFQVHFFLEIITMKEKHDAKQF